jgi:PmbA protein
VSYIDEIQAAFESREDIADYRINLSERRGISVGIRDNDVGSVYSPFSYGQSMGGGFLLQWQDGRLSRGNLDGNSLAIIDQVLQTARQAAYDDPDAAQFLGPQTTHDVPLWSDDVPPLFEDRSSYLLDAVRQLQDLAGRYEAKTLNGGVGASIGESWLRTSRGLDLTTHSTSFGCSASFDGLIGEGVSRRTVPTLEEIDGEIAIAGEYLRKLRDDGGAIGSGRRLVVLHPSVAYSLWSFFVWGNLGGSAVYHGQSPFTIADFESRRQIAREDLTARVDPWQPLGVASFRYTAEGVPSAPVVYIDQGRLTQPIVDLKYARRLNLSPTTPPGATESVYLESQSDSQWDDLRPDLDEAILVLRVLGLHTQDRSSGNYSLSTSQALLVRGGEITGRIKATLNGNFFDNLRDESLRLVRFPGQHAPGFALPLAVAFDFGF